MSKMPLVLKMGGRLLQDDKALDALLAVCAELKQQYPLVLVHGGGDQVDQWLAKFGFHTEKLDGQRVSPAEQMPVITGALAGAVNAHMVARAALQQLNPVGLTLSAGNSCRFELNTKLGAVGVAKPNDAALLQSLLAGGFTPVFCSIGHGEAGQLLNVNADLAAAESGLAAISSQLAATPRTIAGGPQATGPRAALQQAQTQLAELRSRHWFSDQGMRGFAHRQRMQHMRHEIVEGRAVGIRVEPVDFLPLCQQLGAQLGRHAAEFLQYHGGENLVDKMRAALKL